MKKSFLAFLISALILVTVLIWFLNTGRSFSIIELSMLGIVLVLIGFGVFIGISRLKSERAGEAPEDELSKIILQKASSMAYYISLYMWLALAYLIDKPEYETHTIIGVGILGMAILFFACWLFYKLNGMKDA